MPNGASLERTRQVCEQVNTILSNTPGIERYNVIGGMSFLSGTFTPNSASYFVRLKHWKERKTPETSMEGLVQTPQRPIDGTARLHRVSVHAARPAGLRCGRRIQFRAPGPQRQPLHSRTGRPGFSLHGRGAKAAGADGTYSPCSIRAHRRLQLDIDREKVSKLGVPITDVFNTLQASLGGAYVNDFNRFGRLYRVFVQAEADYRQQPDDIGQFYVRSTASGEMIPLSTVVDVRHVSGTEMTTRYNLARSVEISGRAAPGYSSAQAMKALEEVASRVLPREMGYEFSGLSYQEKTAPSPLPTFAPRDRLCLPAAGRAL